MSNIINRSVPDGLRRTQIRDRVAEGMSVDRCVGYYIGHCGGRSHVPRQGPVGAMGQQIVSTWQTEVGRARQRGRHVLPGIALRSGEAPDRSGEAPDEPGAQQERPANVAGEALCPRPCGNRARSPERRCALSEGAHDSEIMRAAPGVVAATPDANEAKVFITDSGQRWHNSLFCCHLKGNIVRHQVRPPRDRPMCDDCKDAAPARTALYASLLHHVGRMRGATATEPASSEYVRRLPRN